MLCEMLFEIIFIYSGIVLRVFYLILIILFGKYSHFIDKMLSNKTTKEGGEFEPKTDCKTLVQRILVVTILVVTKGGELYCAGLVGNTFCPRTTPPAPKEIVHSNLILGIDIFKE